MFAMRLGSAPLAGNENAPVNRVIRHTSAPEILDTINHGRSDDSRGGWARRVGLPAKAVGGGMHRRSSGQGRQRCVRAAFDQAGNSVKAQLAIAYFADRRGSSLYAIRSGGVN